MCGIIGEVRFHADVEHGLGRDSLRFIKNRGPDSDGFFEKENLFLGHTRLSIIDLDSRSNQPFFSSDGNHVLVFNGEIYNYEFLKTRLKGIVWRTTGDTEVVLVYILEFGIKKFCEDAEGMFALAVYSLVSGVLLLARDTFGQKPLYYSLNSHQFRFSSSAEACSLNGSLCEETIQEILGFGFAISDTTAFDGVKSLPRSTYATLEGHILSIKVFERVSTGSFNNLEEALTSAVLATSRADVEIGCFLSGGVDSTILTAIMAKFKRVKTFTIGISEDVQSDELYLAKRIANNLKLEHYYLSIGPKHISENIDKAISSFDTPIMDVSIIPSYIVSELASKHVKVVLGGDGADELFLGYNRHRKIFMNSFLIKILSCSTYLQPELLDKIGFRFGVQKLSDKVIKLKKLTRGKTISDKYFLSLSQSEVGDIKKITGLQDLRLLEYNYYLQNNILRKTDVLTMAHGLESRSPYLDTNFAHWVHRNFSQMELLRGKRKKDLYGLRDSLLPELNDLDTIKRGFGLPISDYIRGNLIDDFKDVINTKTQILPEKMNIEKMKPYELWSHYAMKKWMLTKGLI